MKTHNSAQLLQQLHQQTENILNLAVQQWQMISPAIFKQPPAPDAWSAMQCLGHLNAYGDYYLPAIEKAISEVRQQNKTSISTFKPGWLGNYFTNLMMPNENGVPSKKMKAPKNYTTNNEGDTDCTIAKFIDQQEKLLLLLEEAKNIDLNTIRIPISIAKFIKLKLGDVFMFLIAHNLRHVKQAERAISTATINKNDRSLLVA
ncbi:DinB family protein [Panacibacter ginsenosidivorans]|uniref:DinB family protein n=1 Tax=Panacibacter ginsenosidivorans TaxID=1813871 RepID=A0A5B8VH09_9BACT|nr:DinB family protein [Panacibacter ginsenosidivorans]QEC69856.1 DinB family protein [Panacibacter ginsenosidivorans]